MGQDLLTLPEKTAQLLYENPIMIISLITDLAESHAKFCHGQE